MAQRLMIRRAEENREEEEVTPGSKKLRSANKPTAFARRTRGSPPVFDIKEDGMPGGDAGSNTGPGQMSANDFKRMLNEGLADIARKEHLDQMMAQIKGNSNALISLERKMESTNELNDRRFRTIEERLDGGATPRAEESRKAAYEKSRRSMRVWPIKGDDQDELDANF